MTRGAELFGRHTRQVICSSAEQTERVGAGRRLGAGGGVELAEDIGDVNAGGLRRDEQLGGDLLVAVPGSDQAQHLYLPLGQATRLHAAAVRRAVAEPDPGAPGEDADLSAERCGTELGGERGRAAEPVRRGIAAAVGERGLGGTEQRPGLVIRLAQRRPGLRGGVPRGPDLLVCLLIRAQELPGRGVSRAERGLVRALKRAEDLYLLRDGPQPVGEHRY